VFNQVVEGIREVLPQVDVVRAGSDAGLKLSADDTGIVLGKPLVDQLAVESTDGVVVGMLYETSGLRGVSLDVDRRSIALQIENISAGDVELYVLGSDVNNASANGLGISFLSDAVAHKILQRSERRVAIYVPHNVSRSLPPNYIKVLVDEAWENKWILLSEEMELLRKGFTFAFTPNYLEYGTQLANYYKSGRSHKGYIDGLDVSVSIRAARQNGIDTRRPALKNYRNILP